MNFKELQSLGILSWHVISKNVKRFPNTNFKYDIKYDLKYFKYFFREYSIYLIHQTCNEKI